MALSAVSTRTRAEPRGIADHAIDRRPGPLPHRLSGALVAVGAIGSAVSVFHDPAVTADNARGTDLFLLAVAIPTLSCLDDPGGTRLHASTGCTARRSQLHRLQRGVLRLRDPGYSPGRNRAVAAWCLLIPTGRHIPRVRGGRGRERRLGSAVWSRRR